MSGKPAARVTDPTACPIPGHGVNPIVSGSPEWVGGTVIIGDTVTLVGFPHHGICLGRYGNQ